MGVWEGDLTGCGQGGAVVPPSALWVGGCWGGVEGWTGPSLGEVEQAGQETVGTSVPLDPLAQGPVFLQRDLPFLPGVGGGRSTWICELFHHGLRNQIKPALGFGPLPAGL